MLDEPASLPRWASTADRSQPVGFESVCPSATGYLRAHLCNPPRNRSSRNALRLKHPPSREWSLRASVVSAATKRAHGRS